MPKLRLFVLKFRRCNMGKSRKFNSVLDKDKITNELPNFVFQCGNYGIFTLDFHKKCFSSESKFCFFYIVSMVINVRLLDEKHGKKIRT